MQKCWICNENQANSGEHKIKASEIRKLMKGKKFNGFYINESGLTSINTSKDRVLKFPQIICDFCNNELTKPADDAYNEFLSYVLNSYDEIAASSKIDFMNIYGTKWKQKKIDFYKYIAKHAGCKSHDDKGCRLIDVSSLSSFIKGENYIQNFQIFFQINSIIHFANDVTDLLKADRFADLLGNGATIPLYFKDKIIMFGSIIHSFLRIEWIIADEIIPINFDSRYENVEILDFNFYPNPFSNYYRDNDNLEVLEYLLFGKFKDCSIEDSRDYCLNKFRRIYIGE
ncbi:MAG: hypothetical protein LBV71_06440 [Prevotella sp.]|jgi:hypothetical protein|nr:hypothetical protein [Prevotella sp.]